MKVHPVALHASTRLRHPTLLQQISQSIRHARESGHPETRTESWTPVFTGMTDDAGNSSLAISLSTNFLASH